MPWEGPGFLAGEKKVMLQKEKFPHGVEPWRCSEEFGRGQPALTANVDPWWDHLKGRVFSVAWGDLSVSLTQRVGLAFWLLQGILRAEPSP